MRTVHSNDPHFIVTCGFIIKSDGLDPIFGQLDDILVVGGDQIVFILSLCKLLYFDSHYHAYVISVTSNRILKLISDLLDNTYGLSCSWTQ